MLDLACSLALVAVALLASLAYGVRLALRGPARNARVEREGKSLLVGKGAMEMFQWALGPLGAACERLGVSANAVTFGSVALAVAAGVAVARGHAGVAALLAALSGSGDALDGIVARRTRTTSEAGEVFDSAGDRYSELAVLGGIALLVRDSALLLLLTLLAILAAFMVSYSTAKAQALALPAPRGSMRRSERAVCLILGTGLTPLAALLDPAAARIPITASIALIAVVGNVSALRRLAAIARGARERETASLNSTDDVRPLAAADAPIPPLDREPSEPRSAIRIARGKVGETAP
jgi:CDP-diacylglycerol--glycerol-3-phosphate 3-phosphatidyltransferase